MNRSTSSIAERVTKWAQAQADIHAAFLIGSRARSDHPADQWSDWDVLVICTDPEPYLLQSDWLNGIAPLWLTFLEPTAVGNLTERRALFEGGVDVDFIFMSAALANHMAQAGVPDEIKAVVRRGFRVLVDKAQFAAPFEAAADDPAQEWRAPDERAFQELVQDFVYHGVWVAKKWRRGELWTAKQGLDSYMKRQLLTMLQWHTRATQSWRRNLWHEGRYLEEWADERAVEGLATAFARYDYADIAPALKQTLYLFHWMAEETAAKWGYAFPPAHYKVVIAWINDTLEAGKRAE